MTDTEKSILSIFEKLISFDTTSYKSNLELINFIIDYLKDYNIPCSTVYNDEKTKANIFASLGPVTQGGIVLSGHTDVVPVEGQKWDTEPFELTIKNGTLFGRGTADMKGFIAVVLAAIPIFQKAKLKRPIHLAFSYDEENGCFGAPRLIDAMKKNIPNPLLAIIGEPTDMKVINSHKGQHSFHTKIIGKEAHSSQIDQGANTIEAASKLINFLISIQDRLRDGEIVEHNNDFDPSFSTVQVGVIKGGVAYNITPRDCEFFWENRLLPLQKENLIIDEFEKFAQKKILPSLKVKTEDAAINTIKKVSIPALVANKDSEEENFMLNLMTQNNATGVAYTTEAGIFQQKNIPAIICGPGSIRQAHQANEFIKLEQINSCFKMMLQLSKELSRD